MFRKHKLQVSLVKDDHRSALTTENSPRTALELDAISKMVTKDNIKFAAITVVSVVAGLTLIHTASEIAINAAPKQ